MEEIKKKGRPTNPASGVPLQRLVMMRKGENPKDTDNFKIAVFAVYSVLFEAIVWGLFGYAVFWQDRSGWWILVALMLSGAQLKPKHFGIKVI